MSEAWMSEALKGNDKVKKSVSLFPAGEEAWELKENKKKEKLYSSKRV